VKLKILIPILLFTGLNIFLALNRHSHSDPYSYHGELWADRAGYYVYLPATFQYGFNARTFPPGLDTLTGHGFGIDAAKDRIITKYTSGVAILQAPFYLIGHGIATLLALPDEAYGPVDRTIVDVAGPVYLSAGFLLLFLALRRRHPGRTIVWTLLALYTGSNLFYYTIGDPGMSHIYSFFLFSLLIFLLDGLTNGNARTSTLIALGAVAGSIVLVRPTNVVFLLVAPLLGAPTVKEGLLRWRVLLTPGRLVLFLLPAVAVWVPQLLYWDHAYGSAFTWPYAGEGFTNALAPRTAEFWFAPNNGLFTYTPLYALVLWATVTSWRQGDRGSAAASLVAFLLVSYLGSSWWVWHFGCGFGSRTMVEYLALFAFPLTAWTRWSAMRYGRWLPIALFTLLAAHELKLVYSYGDCWFHDTWDWDAFAHVLFGPTK
jgi:hypothetical protein